jgi:hypothetical protein
MADIVNRNTAEVMGNILKTAISTVMMTIFTTGQEDLINGMRTGHKVMSNILMTEGKMGNNHHIRTITVKEITEAAANALHR